MNPVRCLLSNGVKIKGFTLLEVMVALAIIAFSLITILHSHSLGVKLSTKTKQLSIATMLAQRKLGEIEINGFPDLGEEEGDFGDDYPQFLWKVSVAEEEFFGEKVEGLRKVNITISWKYGAQDDWLDISTLIARREK